MQEEFLYKKSKTGTTITFFNTHLKPDLSESRYPAYIVYNNNNQPSYISTFDGEIKWKNDDFYNVGVNIDEQNLNSITGSVFFQKSDYIIPPLERIEIANSFLQLMESEFSGQSQTYTFFNDVLVEDFNVDICLHRSFKTLDTLAIYNNLRNSFPIQESNTGTVFGRLMATQKITDLSGNNIKVPLKNVPIGIFLPSDDFQNPNSSDNNGNRITLNLSESSSPDNYFNMESFSSDTQGILFSGSKFDRVPEHYKLITHTNEEGEFVLHNVPVGTQTIIFEIDLFKQGLTKDEIALNFYPFPQEEQPNIDSIPSIFFRQFPIDVIPTWGDFQTGYTETNINVNLDLRKWSTFFVPPVTLNGNDVEFLQANGNSEPVKVQIRDMSKENYPIRNIELVEIPDIKDRLDNQQFFWRNEFKQLKNRADIRRKGFFAFKVPANIYDPSGFKTNREGLATNSKGVWLAAYQFKLFYNNPDQLFRSTGQRKVQINSDKFVRRDHFHLNFNDSNYEFSNSQSESIGLGTFPYEQPWTHLYPEPYTIPSLPTVENPNFYEGSEAADGVDNILENPRYLDGDRIGHPFTGAFRDDGFGGGIGGYGIEKDTSIENGEWYISDFAKLVTRNTLYKYENRGDKSEEYANGYRPNDSDFSVQPGVSSVINGEKYQRTECGYGYYLKPEGWARIATYPWWGKAEATFQKDLDPPRIGGLSSAQAVSGGGIIANIDKWNSMNASMEQSGQKISLNLGSNAPSQLHEGYLDIYRIVNSNPNENLSPLIISAREVFVRFNFNYIRIQNAYTNNTLGIGQNPKFKLNPDRQDMYSLNADNYIPAIFTDSFIEIENNGETIGKIKVINGQEFNINPGQKVQKTIFELGVASWNKLLLECSSNSDFDYISKYYKKAKYRFAFKNVKFAKNNSLSQQNNIKLTRDYTNFFGQEIISNLPNEPIKNVFLVSRSVVKTPTNIFGSHNCLGSHFNGPNRPIEYNGIFFDGHQNPRHAISYWKDAPLQGADFTCQYNNPSQNFKHL